MKTSRMLFAAGMLSVLVASPASAGGINLGWNDCFGVSGVVNRYFACNTNAGVEELYISFDPPATIPDVNGSNPLIDLQSVSNPLPLWWQFKNAGSCRQTSLSGVTGLGTCQDPWSGQQTGGIAAYLTNQVLPSMPPNRARILGSVAVPTTFAAQVDPGTEYMVMTFRINHARTVGPDACTGCNVPVCIVLSEVLLTSNNSGDTRITNPLASSYCTWQGGLIVLNNMGCPGGSPVTNRTWGEIKSAYR